MGLKYRSEEDKAKLSFTQQDLDIIYAMNNPPELEFEQYNSNMAPPSRTTNGRRRYTAANLNYRRFDSRNSSALKNFD